MKRLVQGLFVLLFLATGTVSAQEKAANKAPAAHVPFIEGRPFAEILKKAKATKKPLMIDVYATWCGPCKLMDRTTFADPGVISWVKATVIPVRFDAEKGEGRRVAIRYGAFSFPTVLFLDPDGNEIDRLLGLFGPDEFREAGPNVLSRQSPLLARLDSLKKTWNVSDALYVANVLTQRHDVARLRPIVLRLVTDEPDLSRPEILQMFVLLVVLEDFQEKVSPETADLLTTFLPRLGIDSRRGMLAAALIRERARSGDVAGARATATTTLGALGDSTPYGPEILAALGAAEKKAGRFDAAVMALRRAIALADKAGNGTANADRQIELADALTGAGRTTEAKAALAKGVEMAAEDAKVQAKASAIALKLKEPAEAVARARRAVELTQGEDAGAQAALASALTASGDAAGAQAAWRRAAEFEPDNATYRRQAGKAAPVKPAKTS
jgi:tetratricopeptide (TPR) repeat protein/thioredoxin-related protein